MAKFDPQPTLNPLTDRHQIWNTWLCRGHVLPRKTRGQSAQGFLPPHTWNIHPKPSNVYFFFSFLKYDELYENCYIKAGKTVTVY